MWGSVGNEKLIFLDDLMMSGHAMEKNFWLGGYRAKHIAKLS